MYVVRLFGLLKLFKLFFVCFMWFLFFGLLQDWINVFLGYLRLMLQALKVVWCALHCFRMSQSVKMVLQIVLNVFGCCYIEIDCSRLVSIVCGTFYI